MLRHGSMLDDGDGGLAVDKMKARSLYEKACKAEKVELAITPGSSWRSRESLKI